MRIRTFAAIILLLILPLGGCVNKRQIEEQAYVVAVGFDKSKKEHLVSVTFQIANPQVANTASTPQVKEQPTDMITLEVPNLLAAKDQANVVIPRRINLSHLKTLIISEEFAKSEFFHHTLASMVIDQEIRRDVSMIVTKEKAVKFIRKNKPEMETRPHKYYEFMQETWETTGFVPFPNINRYLTRHSGQLFLTVYATAEKEKDPEIKSNIDDYIAGQMPQKGGDPVQMIGAAVFKNGKMIGKLTGEETRIAVMLRRKSLVQDTIYSIPDPVKGDYWISVRLLKSGNAHIKVNTKTEPPRVDVTVPLQVQVLSNPALTNYSTNSKHQRMLTNAINNSLEKDAEELIKKTQKKYKSEPFLWNLNVRRQFWTNKAADDYDWLKKYPDAVVNVNMDATITNFGGAIQPPKLQEKD